jgi:hypothetical protein
MKIPSSLRLLADVTNVPGQTGRYDTDHVCVHGTRIYATDTKLAVAVEMLGNAVSTEPLMIPRKAWDEGVHGLGAELATTNGGFALTQILPGPSEAATGTTKIVSGKAAQAKFPPVDLLLQNHKKPPEYQVKFKAEHLKKVAELAIAHRMDLEDFNVVMNFHGENKCCRIHVGEDQYGNSMQILLMPIEMEGNNRKFLSETESIKLRTEVNAANALTEQWQKKHLEVTRELDGLKAVIAKAMSSATKPTTEGEPDRQCNCRIPETEGAGQHSP